MKKLEREALLADRAAAAEVLASIPQDDVLGRLSFQSRLEQLDKQIEDFGQAPESTSGSVALVFAGEPIHGARSIDVKFASEIVRAFQDLVTSQVASDEIGVLAARGPLPLHAPSNLAIADVVRGSVGFILEEATPNLEIVDSRVKKAISEVTNIIERTSSENDADFDQAIESVDQRFLGSLRSFFQTLSANHAGVRIVEDQKDMALDYPTIARATRRVEAMDIQETEADNLVIELVGILPATRRFEMRLPGSPDVIKGSVGTVTVPQHLELNKKWRVKMRVRQVRELNKAPRTVYTLVGLLEQMPD
jgi:hypothetical protein